MIRAGGIVIPARPSSGVEPMDRRRFIVISFPGTIVVGSTPIDARRGGDVRAKLCGIAAPASARILDTGISQTAAFLHFRPKQGRTGGQTELAGMLEGSARTTRNKPAGKTPISRSR